MFLLSTTHGAETTGLAAYLAVSKAYAERDVVAEMEMQGTKLRSGLEQVAEEARHVGACGLHWVGPRAWFLRPRTTTANRLRLSARSFIQELLRRGVLGQSLVISAAHTDADIDQTIEAAAGALEVYAQGDRGGQHRRPACRKTRRARDARVCRAPATDDQVSLLERRGAS